MGEIGEILDFGLLPVDFGLDLLQAIHGRLYLLPALINLCLARDQGVPLTAKGRDETVQIVNPPARRSQLRVKVGECGKRGFLPC